MSKWSQTLCEADVVTVVVVLMAVVAVAVVRRHQLGPDHAGRAVGCWGCGVWVPGTLPHPAKKEHCGSLQSAAALWR